MNNEFETQLIQMLNPVKIEALAKVQSNLHADLGQIGLDVTDAVCDCREALVQFNKPNSGNVDVIHVNNQIRHIIVSALVMSLVLGERAKARF